MNTEIVTIGIVDDHPVFRKGLTFFFQHASSNRVILEAGNGKELQEALRKEPLPDILLLDISMPVMGGIAAMKWLHQTFPDLPVIILTCCETNLTMIQLYLLGARAILQKGICEKELLKAITRVKEEGYYYNDNASRRLLVQLYANTKKQTENIKPVLTEKEERFLQLAATEMTYHQIAATLDVSERCVDKIRNRLFEKLGVQNRSSLVLQAERNGLLEIAA